MAKMAHLSIIDFLKEFTSKEFERQGKGIWNYLKFHCSLKMWNLSILNQSIRKQKRNLNCEFGIPPREESTELSILKTRKWNLSVGFWHPSEGDVSEGVWYP